MSAPISNGFTNGPQCNHDTAHGKFPIHMDVRMKMPDLPGVCQKLRVDSSGKIISDEMEFGKRFLKDLLK